MAEKGSMVILGFKVQPITSQERRDMIGQRKWPVHARYRMTLANLFLGGHVIWQ